MPSFSIPSSNVLPENLWVSAEFLLLSTGPIENRKSAVRCKVEHAFRIIKCQFGYRKTVYRGLKKNENRLYAMFACANLYALAMAGRKLSTT